MKRALIVGLDHYRDDPLEGCVNDALLMAEVLGRHEDGARNYDIQTVTSAPDREVTRAQLRHALEELFDSTGDDVLFYFSGHGQQTSWGAELVATDYEGVSMQDVLTLAMRSSAREVVVILDCCFSGDVGNVAALSLGENVSVLRPGILILAAARSNEVSREQAGQGLFTRLLIEGLQGAAADHLGNVSSLSLYDFAARGFDAWEQRPVLKGHLESTCVMRHVKPFLDPALLRDLPNVFGSAAASVSLDPDYEGERCEGVPLTEHQQAFEKFKRLRNAGLLTTSDGRDLYWTALDSGSVKLTAIGRYFWRLARDGKL